MRDQMQDDTDAGMFAWMQNNASDKEWTQFCAVLLTQDARKG
jgi:hypothetical protein